MIIMQYEIESSPVLKKLGLFGFKTLLTLLMCLCLFSTSLAYLMMKNFSVSMHVTFFCWPADRARLFYWFSFQMDFAEVEDAAYQPVKWQKDLIWWMFYVYFHFVSFPDNEKLSVKMSLFLLASPLGFVPRWKDCLFFIYIFLLIIYDFLCLSYNLKDW